MKPRRWYSSPEHNPQPNWPSVNAFPDARYWVHASNTRPGQGAPVRRTPPDGAASPRREIRLEPVRPRRIDAA